MLGDELRKAREQAEMTQEQLSFAAGVDRSYISLLENDHKSPTVDVLFRLCDALGVAASDLLARVEATRKPKARKK
jgi:transcriptional regulator with XRE-family HTH domain